MLLSRLVLYLYFIFFDTALSNSSFDFYVFYSCGFSSLCVSCAYAYNLYIWMLERDHHSRDSRTQVHRDY